MNQICNNCRYQQITKPDGANVPGKVACQKGIIGDEIAYAKYLVGSKPLKCEFWEKRDGLLETN